MEATGSCLECEAVQDFLVLLVFFLGGVERGFKAWVFQLNMKF